MCYFPKIVVELVHLNLSRADCQFWWVLWYWWLTRKRYSDVSQKSMTFGCLSYVHISRVPSRYQQFSQVLQQFHREKDVKKKYKSRTKSGKRLSFKTFLLLFLIADWEPKLAPVSNNLSRWTILIYKACTSADFTQNSGGNINTSTVQKLGIICFKKQVEPPPVV